MILKAIFFFLAFMVVLGIFGKWRFPGQSRLASAKCPKCQRFKIGKGPCVCEKGRP
ncbi:hypothetical protein [Yoonia sp. R2-816]|uniref:hypothetical protein n=1 Tax=Yoonia sp. R2-816 TaxID=3342638 RepID=UPI00372B1FA1